MTEVPKELEATEKFNYDYDYNEAMEKEQKDNIGKPEEKQQCYKTRKECEHKCSGLCKESF